MTTLPEMAVALRDRLERARIPYAFGGALALAYHIEEPRGTRDIDVNIFVRAIDARSVLEQLPSEVHWTDQDVEEIARDGQVRVFWDETPVDLFFVTHRFHESAATHIEIVPFDDTSIPILSANDLAVFKAFFDRTRDWADIEAMLAAESLDVHVVLGWLVDLLRPDDHRITRLRALLDREPPPRDPRFAP